MGGISDPSAEQAVQLKDIWKSYGGVPVLKGVTLGIRPGEIHALIGGNGAGKSTLMKILTGVEVCDSGEILIHGESFRRLNPREAHAIGVYLVPQEPSLFPNLTVLENIQLSLPADRRPSRAQVAEAVASLGQPIDLDQLAKDLSISGQQLIELARGLLHNARVLIVDEPTAALTARETQLLFEQLKKMAADGMAIFYITHRLHEVFDLCDSASVLRDGVLVLECPTAECDVDALVNAMVPDRADAASGFSRERICDPNAEPALVIDNLSGEGFRNISLRIAPGEVVGLAGVVGSGRTELAETVFGIRPVLDGKILLHGTELKGKRSPRKAMAAGIGYVPEDRHAHGVFLSGTVVENATSGVLDRIAKVLVKTSEANRVSDDLMDQVALQPGPRTRKVLNLSGGNQQKVALAKNLACEPTVLILDEPTRGIDAGARLDLYAAIEALALRGLAVLLISSDFEEIAQLSTRVLIMRDGQVKNELHPPHISVEAVHAAAFGGKSGVSAA